MTDLLTPSERTCQAAHAKAVTTGYRSAAELQMREALEAWCRERWPAARVVHELVMGRGKVRCDMAAIGPDHLAAFEIKSPYDDTTRLLHQTAMFRLAVPELWIVTTQWHSDAVELITWLMPSIGVLVLASEAGRDRVGPYHVAQEHPGQVIEPHPRALASLCWAGELMDEARLKRLLMQKKPATHPFLVKLLTEKLAPGELLASVCRQLRARDALWRADPPMFVDPPKQAAAP